jgi:hypothetical protein
VLYPLTTFLAAFLLFQIQPMIARAILPWFGGSAMLWTVVVLFFQVVLLAGYGYAYWVLRGLSPGRQRLLHLGVLGLSLLALPVAPHGDLKPPGGQEPVASILSVLGRMVGLPYFLLAATAPLLQGWYAQEVARGGGRRWLPSPYVLYAVSNVGSLLALLSYPFVIEPVLGLRLQFGVWSATYGVFAGALVLLAWIGVRRTGPGAAGAAAATADDAGLQAPEAPSALALVAALGLAAATNTLLLAVTAALSHNIAPVPLLWVVPLALYLLSFALPFGLAMRRIRLVLPFLAVLALVPIAHVVTASGKTPLPMRLGLLVLPFFAICLACHAELAHLKPHPHHLSSFYLMIALGGALGGVFAGVLAPLVFAGHHELPLSLAACAALAVGLLARARGWSWWNPLVIGSIASAVAVPAYMVREAWDDLANARLATRNFYGTLVVRDNPAGTDTAALRVLLNGSVQHGAQLLDATERAQPTTYYGLGSGVELAIRAAQVNGAVRVGVIGLGTGTLASYGRSGDVYVFYEINPLVVGLASTEFSFLRDSPARTEVVPGDGRLALERDGGPPFDVLVIDAFSGDSIPVHLLTREAFTLYFRRLAPAGILALHISNKYIDLEPVARAAAEALDKRAVVVSTDDDFPRYGSTWVLLSGRDDLLATPDIEDASRPLSDTAAPVAWTDDYSNLLSVLKR